MEGVEANDSPEVPVEIVGHSQQNQQKRGLIGGTLLPAPRSLKLPLPPAAGCLFLLSLSCPLPSLPASLVTALFFSTSTFWPEHAGDAYYSSSITTSARRPLTIAMAKKTAAAAAAADPESATTQVNIADFQRTRDSVSA